MKLLLTASTLALLAAACGRGPTFKEPLSLGGKAVSVRALNHGKEIFEIYCSSCHGLSGDGKGPAAVHLRPPARNFRQGLFKFGGVPSGQLPHDEDLLRVVQNGLHGTAMLPWRDVPERDLLDALQYIKTFSPKWRDRVPGERIVPPPDPWGEARREEAVARGARVYYSLASCASCHPAYEPEEAVHGAKLTESSYGPKLMSPDFTRDALRNGSSLPDLYRTIAAGIGGTAMPTWKDSLADDDIWAMAWYVRSLVELKGTPEARALRERLAKAP